MALYAAAPGGVAIIATIEGDPRTEQHTLLIDPLRDDHLLKALL